MGLQAQKWVCMHYWWVYQPRIEFVRTNSGSTGPEVSLCTIIGSTGSEVGLYVLLMGIYQQRSGSVRTISGSTSTGVGLYALLVGLQAQKWVCRYY